jgi:hypothetical protein
MSQYIRWSLLGEIKDLFKRHKATYIGPYDAERKNFTKNLVRQLKPQRTVDSARTLYNILVSELQLTFQDVKRLPFLIKNPEDPRFTQNLLHFINHAKLYKMGIQFTYELIGEFKNTLRILGSDPTTWESQP